MACHDIYPLPCAMDLPELWALYSSHHHWNQNPIYTHTSMALFQFMMYPLSANVSMCTTWMLPFSVPTYSHLLATGRCKHVILQGEKRKEGIDFYTHVAFIKNIKYAHPAAPPRHPLSTVITEQSQATQLVQWHSSSSSCEHGTLLYSSTAAPT